MNSPTRRHCRRRNADERQDADDDRQHDAPGDDRSDQRRVRQRAVRSLGGEEADEALVVTRDAVTAKDDVR